MFKEVIRESGESQKRWAARLGISPSYLSLLLRGHKQPSLDLAVAIEKATDGRVAVASWVRPAQDDLSLPKRVS